MNKKILLITYYWPPSAGSGVQRWLKFAKYLPQFGWQPIVYTPANPDFDITDASLLKDIPPECVVIKEPIWEPYNVYRTLTGKKKGGVNFGVVQSKNQSKVGTAMQWIRGNMMIPDPRKFWVKPSVKFLKKYLAENQVDAIVTTGPPHSLHLIGLELKKQFNTIPWIADMRDPWATFDILHKFHLRASSLKKHQALEAKVVANADKTIVVSPSMADAFVTLKPNKLAIIHNGYDPSDFAHLPPTPTHHPNFNLYHTGLLNDLRNPDKLWQALNDLCQNNPDFNQAFRLELIGNVDKQVQAQIAQHPLVQAKTNIQGWVSHDEILATYPKASAFLLLLNNSDNAQAQITGKFYEYLAARLPILALGPANSDVAGILQECKAGTIFDYDDYEGIKAGVLQLFENYQQQKNTPSTSKSVAQFSRENLTKKLVALLAELQ